MKNQLIVLCTAALLSTAAVADENRADNDKSDPFASLDADSDGTLSKEELSGSASLAASFDKLDGNSDGFISKREFRRNTRPKPQD